MRRIQSKALQPDKNSSAAGQRIHHVVTRASSKHCGHLVLRLARSARRCWGDLFTRYIFPIYTPLRHISGSAGEARNWVCHSDTFADPACCRLRRIDPSSPSGHLPLTSFLPPLKFARGFATRPWSARNRRGVGSVGKIALSLSRPGKTPARSPETRVG